MPAYMAARQAADSDSSAGRGVPTATVTAASPCQPSRIAPQSIEIRSPSASTVVGDGMPCTTCSLTDAQIDAGNPWYPRNDGSAPASRIVASATASRSAVLAPGRTASVTAARVAATTRPAARIASI